MEQKKETPVGQHSIKYKLDYRTDIELAESIRKKRENGEPLDEKEAELVKKQRVEDNTERNNTYPH